MGNKMSSRLEKRIRHFSTEDLQAITDRLFGAEAYSQLINALDDEIARSTAVIRKGTTIQDAQEIADRRVRLAVEMQEARRYRKTKLGKLHSNYLPIIHQLRNADIPMSWPNIVRMLKIKYRFSVSVPYLCRVYDDWKKQLEGAN